MLAVLWCSETKERQLLQCVTVNMLILFLVLYKTILKNRTFPDRKRFKSQRHYFKYRFCEKYFRCLYTKPDGE